MFGNSTLGEAVTVFVVVFVGAYVHYRVSIRRKQTRLAIGMLEQDDLGVVAALDQLVKKKQIEPVPGFLESAKEPAPPAAEKTN